MFKKAIQFQKNHINIARTWAEASKTSILSHDRFQMLLSGITELWTSNFRLMCESLQLQHWEKHEHYTTSQFLLLMLAYKIFFKPYHAKNGISPGRTAYGSDNDEAKFSVSFPGVLSNSFPGKQVMAWESGSYVLWMLSAVLCISFSCWLHFFGIYCYWNYWPLLVNTTPLRANHFYSLLLLSVSCL